jgi:hypothetical protein
VPLTRNPAMIFVATVILALIVGVILGNIGAALLCGVVAGAVAAQRAA